MGKALAHVVDDPAMRYKDIVLSFLLNSPGHRATRVEVLKKFWNRFDSDMLDRVMRSCIEARLVKQYTTHEGKVSNIMYEIAEPDIK